MASKSACGKGSDSNRKARPADIIRPTDSEARALARTLMQEARFAALGVITADGTPLVTRIAFTLCPQGRPVSLVSGLSAHTRALHANPACSLMVGEPGTKGDPLTHPRLSLTGTARFVENGTDERAVLADHYLQINPKAKIYIGLGDFTFVRFDVTAGHMNGGFGKAFHLSPADLGL